MDCYRLENALGVFLPNGKAAGDSGGLCQRSTVNCQRPIDARCSASAFEHICPLGDWGGTCNYAGQPACAPYGSGIDRPCIPQGRVCLLT